MWLACSPNYFCLQFMPCCLFKTCRSGGGSAVRYLFPNLSNSVWAVASYCRLKDSLGEAWRREACAWGVRKQSQICSSLQCAGPWSAPCSSEHLHMSMNTTLNTFLHTQRTAGPLFSCHSCVPFLDLTVQICPGFPSWKCWGEHC